MALQAGQRLGPFEVIAPLGAGGMGEVYRVRDARLSRDVALKVLPEFVAGDADRRRRFEREARAVAALDHPGVLALYDVGEADGVAYMVTELLEGETLRERLLRGPVPAERVAEWGAAAAEALAVAHARGIVHRDLKPANLFLTRDGRLKILDFGLAKDLETPAGAGDPTAPILTSGGEPALGTPGYMSPEQARGEAVDGRSDLFSLGCILYEGLTGRRAFDGQGAPDLLAALLRDDPPDIRALRPDVPDALARIVQRCLGKERDARFQSASDLAFALRSIALAQGMATARDGGLAPQPERRRLWPLALGFVGVALVGLAVGRGLRLRAPAGPEPLILALTPGTNQETGPAISPDGKFVAYVASERDRADVWVKFVGGGPAVDVTASSGLTIERWAPEISPDGGQIAVRARLSGETNFYKAGIWLIPAPLGGPPRKLVDRAGGLRWSSDGRRIVYLRPDPATGDSILVANADGTDEHVLVESAGVHYHEPTWSRDGAWVYFTRGLHPTQPPIEIWRVPSSGGVAERVVATPGLALSPLLTPDGRTLIYAGDQSGGALNLWRRPLDGGRERRLTRGFGDYLAPRLSRDGRRLVCEVRTSVGSLYRVPVPRGLGAGTRTRSEAERVDVLTHTPGLGQPLTGAGAEDGAPSIARTGRIAFSSTRNGTRDIWICDADGANPRPLTSDAEDDGLPAISPDGSRVAFVSNRRGRHGLWLVSAEGGVPRALVMADILDRPSWSGDGRRLVYAAEGAGAQPALWVISADGGAPTAIPSVKGRAPIWAPHADLIAYTTSAPEVGLVTRFVDSAGHPRQSQVLLTDAGPAAFSWNGRWLAQGRRAPDSDEAEIVILDVVTGREDAVLRLRPMVTVGGVAWSPDDTHITYGLVQYESRVLLFDGLSLD